MTMNASSDTAMEFLQSNKVQEFVAGSAGKTEPTVMPQKAPSTAMTDEEIEDWIADKRALYAAGALRPSLVARLERIEGWTWA